MKVDVKNIHILIMRLRIQLNAHGMQLNSDEFEELVYQNNDVGYIIRKCGEFLDTKSCSTQSSLVSIDPDVLKGSVEVARGRRPSLQGEPSVRWHSLKCTISQCFTPQAKSVSKLTSCRLFESSSIGTLL